MCRVLHTLSPGRREAAFDQRYAGRDFADVEPELRRSHSGHQTWEQLREEIREAFERGRRRSIGERQSV